MDDDLIFSLTEEINNVTCVVDQNNNLNSVFDQTSDNSKLFNKTFLPIKINSANARSRWQAAARKIKFTKDPWAEFKIDEYPIENVIRHRYDPVKKEWHTDDCVVRMESKPFAHGNMRACFRL